LNILGQAVTEYVRLGVVLTTAERLSRVKLAVDLYEMSLAYGWMPHKSLEFKEQFIVSRAKSLSSGSLRDALNAVRNYSRWASSRGVSSAFAASSVQLLLAQYLQDVRRARLNKVGAPNDRGLAAKGRLRGLGVFANYGFAAR